MMFLTKTKIALVTFAFLLANSSGAILAQQPEGVVRTFMITNLVDENVDFSDENSVLLKVNKNSGGDVTKTFFTDQDHLSAFSGGRFRFGVSAMYITRGLGQTPVGGFAWLLDEDTPEPPPTGSVALLGPDVVVLQTETFYWYANSGFIYTTNDSTKSTGMIVTAVFTR